MTDVYQTENVQETEGDHYTLKIYGAPYGIDGSHLPECWGSEDALAIAANHLQQGQHVRVFDDSGAEVNRIYPST